MEHLMRLVCFGRRRLSLEVALFLIVVSLGTRATADDAPGDAILVLQGTSGDPIRLSEADFKKLPHVEVDAVDHGGAKARYSGVPLRALLDRLGVPQGDKVRGKWIGSFVAVEALDDYRAVFGLAELDPAFNDRAIILADLRNGQPLDKKHGPFQVIAPSEKRQARWVRMVKEIRVVDSRAAK
jgi:hypothetical protein